MRQRDYDNILKDVSKHEVEVNIWYVDLQVISIFMFGMLAYYSGVLNSRTYRQNLRKN